VQQTIKCKAGCIKPIFYVLPLCCNIMNSSSDENEFDDTPIAKMRSKNNGTTTAVNVKVEPVQSSNSSPKVPSKKRKKKTSTNGTKTSRSNGKKKKVKKEESDDETNFQPKKKRNKPTVKKEGGTTTTTKNRELKKLDKAERLSHAMQSFLWWDAPEPPEGCQWATMEHAGVSFTEPYKPHGIKMLYDGNPVDLNPVEEESATFFASMDPEGPHLGNPKTAPIFTKNFFTDFKAVLDKKTRNTILPKMRLRTHPPPHRPTKNYQKGHHRRTTQDQQSRTQRDHVQIWIRPGGRTY